MNKKCQWPECHQPGLRGVSGELYCNEHEPERLRQLVREGIPALTFDESGRPHNRQWLNRFARLATSKGDVNRLSKSKIEMRALKFSIEGDIIKFSVERHPVGRVMKQQWQFDLGTSVISMIEETEVSSIFPKNASGEYCCPRCNEVIDVTPGRASCWKCGFQELHEHAL